MLNVRRADAVMRKAQKRSIAAVFVKKSARYYNVKQCGHCRNVCKIMDSYGDAIRYEKIMAGRSGV